MVTQARYLNAEAFDEWVILDENADRLLEYIAGEVYEVPSNPYASQVAALFLFFILSFVREQGIAGHVTGADGGYKVGGGRFAPDVAFISAARQPQLNRKGYNDHPPDLAIEVISDPTNQHEQTKLRQKLTTYLSAGVIVWIVNIETQSVEIHQAGKAAQLVDADGTVQGGDVLPGFALPLRQIFPKPPAETEAQAE